MAMSSSSAPAPFAAAASGGNQGRAKEKESADQAGNTSPWKSASVDSCSSILHCKWRVGADSSIIDSEVEL
ncbi:unnamed protein product [Urochloa humidicola]